MSHPGLTSGVPGPTHSENPSARNRTSRTGQEAPDRPGPGLPPSLVSAQGAPRSLTPCGLLLAARPARPNVPPGSQKRPNAFTRPTHRLDSPSTQMAPMGGDMSQQYPQQPGWGQPQQPQPPQPGWGAPPQQPGWGAPPPQPPKRNAGKTIAIIAAAFVGVLVIGAVASNSEDSSGNASSSSSAKETAAVDRHRAAAPSDDAAKAEEPKAEEPKADKPKVVTFKVWGKAPAGALGPLDINYGSDSDSRAGKFKNGKFEATLPLNDDALWYHVMAQLQGSGDIQCSVTVDGETKTGHASGDYNICDAQLSADFLGGWS